MIKIQPPQVWDISVEEISYKEHYGKDYVFKINDCTFTHIAGLGVLKTDSDIFVLIFSLMLKQNVGFSNYNKCEISVYYVGKAGGVVVEYKSLHNLGEMKEYIKFTLNALKKIKTVEVKNETSFTLEGI